MPTRRLICIVVPGVRCRKAPDTCRRTDRPQAQGAGGGTPDTVAEQETHDGG